MCPCNEVERLRAVVVVAIAAETGMRKAGETNCKVRQRTNILLRLSWQQIAFLVVPCYFQDKTEHAFSLTSVMLICTELT